jgi:hypothetical protein
MPTVEERYAAATRYVREALTSVEGRAIGYAINPATGQAEWYAGALKAQPAREELARITARWLRASTNEERERIAGEVEALAVLVIETMPAKGCIRDAGIVDVQTPGSIKAEMDTTAGVIRQLDEDIVVSRVDATFKSAWRGFVEEWDQFYKEHSGWLGRWFYSAYEKTVEFRRRALTWREKFVALGGVASAPTDKPPETAADQVKQIGKYLLIGGGILVGWKAFAYLRERQQRAVLRSAGATRRALNTALARTATRRDTPPWLRSRNAGRKAWDYDAVAYDGGVYCVDCLPKGVDDEDVTPIFATDEVDHAQVCDRCGAVHDYMNVREPDQRDASGGRHAPHTYSLRLKRGEIEALQFLSGRYTSAKAFYDGLTPLDNDADQALSREFVRGQGPYRFQIRASDVRKALRATVGDGGEYGAIPNLRSDAVDWVLAEEWRRAP